MALLRITLKTFAIGAIGATLAITATLASVQRAVAFSIRSGFDSNTLPRNDDGSTGLVNIGFDTNFFGENYSQLYVNNNGNVTFGGSLSTFTPFALTGATSRPIIAAFFADVDTRNPASGIVSYGNGSVDGRQAFGVNYPNVGYFAGKADKLNNFQLLLIDRSDTGVGNFDIEFNYGQIQWETGDSSRGSNGLGGTSARAGYSNGTGVLGTFLELAGSGVNGAFLDGGPNSLVANSNIGIAGRYLFTARNGVVENPEAVPEPATIAGGVAAIGFGARMMRKRKQKQTELVESPD